MQATRQSPTGSGPRPRGTGKLLTITPEGYALAMLRLEVFQAAETKEMRLWVQAAEGPKYCWDVLPRRPSWWPSELTDEERRAHAP